MTDADGHTESSGATLSDPGSRIPQQGAPTHCHTCGGPAPGTDARVIGVWSLAAGRAVWDCAGCARRYLVEIEKGLGRERW